MDKYQKAQMDSINAESISIVINEGKFVCHRSSANIGSH